MFGRKANNDGTFLIRKLIVVFGIGHPTDSDNKAMEISVPDRTILVPVVSTLKRVGKGKRRSYFRVRHLVFTSPNILSEK